MQQESALSMKTLYVLRHAKSSWQDVSLADHDRPLKKRGRIAAPRMGKWARINNAWPDAIVSSTAVRAQQTAAAFVKAGKYDLEIELTPKLYEASTEDVLNLLRPRKEHAILLVGHNPTMEDLVADLTGKYLRFVTAAFAWIELPIEAWSEIGSVSLGVGRPGLSDHLGGVGHLREFWIPRALE